MLQNIGQETIFHTGKGMQNYLAEDSILVLSQLSYKQCALYISQNKTVTHSITSKTLSKLSMYLEKKHCSLYPSRYNDLYNMQVIHYFSQSNVDWAVKDTGHLRLLRCCLVLHLLLVCLQQ